MDAEGGGDGGPVISASRTATLWPRWAMATAREAVTVLLPTPPLPLTTAMTFLMLERELAGARRSREPQSALQEEQSCVHSDIFLCLLSAPHTGRGKHIIFQNRRAVVNGKNSGHQGVLLGDGALLPLDGEVGGDDLAAILPSSEPLPPCSTAMATAIWGSS